MRRTFLFLQFLWLALICNTALASLIESPELHFRTTDGVDLAYFVYKKNNATTALVFVPGWTMPASIFGKQVVAFRENYTVVSFDPRGQGMSAVPNHGYTDKRRAQDLLELIEQLPEANIVIVGWSLGVLESLQLSQLDGFQKIKPRIKGWVFVDNSVGEATPPKGDPKFFEKLTKEREKTVRRFVSSMFKTEQTPSYINGLVNSSLKVPLTASKQLLSYPGPRERWKTALYALEQPFAYFVTPRFFEQAAAVQAQKPKAFIQQFPDAGHAIFVDAPAQFNAALQQFLNSL